MLGRVWENVRVVFEHVLDKRDADTLAGWFELFGLFHDMRGSYAEALAFLCRAEAVLEARGAACAEV